jgi:hypothetical protein
MSDASLITVVGYVIASKTIEVICGAEFGSVEYFFAMAGIFPIGLYCGYLDSQGR